MWDQGSKGWDQGALPRIRDQKGGIREHCFGSGIKGVGSGSTASDQGSKRWDQGLELKSGIKIIFEAREKTRRGYFHVLSHELRSTIPERNEGLLVVYQSMGV